MNDPLHGLHLVFRNLPIQSREDVVLQPTQYTKLGRHGTVQFPLQPHRALCHAHRQLIDRDLHVVLQTVKVIEVARQSDAKGPFDGHPQHIVERFCILRLPVLDRPGPGGISDGGFSIAKDERERLCNRIRIRYCIVEGPTSHRDSRPSPHRIGSALHGKVVKSNFLRVPLIHFEEEGEVTCEEVAPDITLLQRG